MPQNNTTSSVALLLARITCGAFFLALASGAKAQHTALLPAPVHVAYENGSIALSRLCAAPLEHPSPEDAFAMQTLQQNIPGLRICSDENDGTPVRLHRTEAVDTLPVPGEAPGPNAREAYHIRIAPSAITLEGRSSAAVFYAVQTLSQMAETGSNGLQLPLAQVDDWPALSYRATLMDAGSEGPMLTFDELKRQIDFIAKWKGNQFFFYSEGNIELKGYPLLNPDARFTQQQIRELIAYAQQRHIDVVPAIEMYGHLHDLFRIEKYARLADFPHGSQFDPTKPEVEKVLRDWVSQIVPLFPSPFVDVGFDETWSLQRAAAQTRSSTPVQLFVQQLNTVGKLFQSQGKTMMAYADIMVKFPGIVQQLPPGVIALPWWYDASPDPEYHRWLDPLIAEHVPNIVTSGVTSWDEIAPDYTLSFENIDTLLAAGVRSHSMGLINTLWTDDGQVLLQMSWPSMAYGAAAAWQQQGHDRRIDPHTFFRDYSVPIVCGVSS